VTRDTFGYHFSHVDNLDSILESGGLCCDTTVDSERKLVTETADATLKQKRRAKRVAIEPGGVLADYVPFYFASTSPMLYRVCTGWKVTRQAPQSDLIFFVVETGHIQQAGHQVVISDGHPLAAFSEFWPVECMQEKVSWDVMEGNQWNDTDEDSDRKRRRQAEFLVHHFVPMGHLEYLVCKEPKVQERVEERLRAAGHNTPVLSMPDKYYPGRP
jgi:hypothetical protein